MRYNQLSVKAIVLLFFVFSTQGCASIEHRTAWVYIDNGEIQCESQGATPLQTSVMLTDQKINVQQSLCGHLTQVMVASMCGAKTTRINVHKIEFQNVELASEIGFFDVDVLKNENDIGYSITDCQ